MSEMDQQVTERAVEIVRQAAHVSVERGELARLLGFELDATAEKELGRRLHQLAGQAWHVFELCDREQSLLAELEAKTAAEEQDSRDWYVVNMLGRLTPGQRAGTACLHCDHNFDIEPGRPSIALDGHHLNVHNDPAVCNQILAARLAKEVPF